MHSYWVPSEYTLARRALSMMTPRRRRGCAAIPLLQCSKLGGSFCTLHSLRTPVRRWRTLVWLRSSFAINAIEKHPSNDECFSMVTPRRIELLFSGWKPDVLTIRRRGHYETALILTDPPLWINGSPELLAKFPISWCRQDSADCFCLSIFALCLESQSVSCCTPISY